MKIFSLYRDFFRFLKALSASPDKWDAYRTYYYRPHREFLDAYFSHFPLLDPLTLRQRVEKIKPADYSWLKSLLSASPPEDIILRAYQRCLRVVPPPSQPDVYFFVGFFSPDGFVMELEGEPVICFGLERFKDFRLLKILFAHEYAHFLLNSTTADVPEGKKLMRLLISEGAATYFSKLAFPHHRVSDHFLFRRDRLNWCQRNEVRIRDVYCSGQFSNEELLDFYFKGNPELNLPPRAAKYLGYQVVKKYLEKNREESIGTLLLSKKQFELVF